MALLWVEGFEGFGTTGAPTPDIDRKYPVTNRTSFMAGIETGRISYALNTATTSNPYFQTPSLGSITEIITGFAFKYSFLINGSGVCHVIDTNGALGCNLTLFSSGLLVFRRGSTRLATSVIALRPDRWYYIELKMTIHDTTGSAVLKINGAQQFSISGVDTKVGSVTTAQGFRYWGTINVNAAYTYDDLYICDTTGSANNDFLGSIRVDSILPNAAGDATQWTPSAGANYATMDENPQDDDTTYVEDSTSTDQDLYNYASMPSVDTINGLQINTTVRETDVSDFTLKTLIKSGTTVSADSAQAIAGTSFETLVRVAELDPDTSSAWTESGVNAAQFGVEVG
jgi:hypothetical protein